MECVDKASFMITLKVRKSDLIEGSFQAKQKLFQSNIL